MRLNQPIHNEQMTLVVCKACGREDLMSDIALEEGFRQMCCDEGMLTESEHYAHLECLSAQSTVGVDFERLPT